MTPPASYRVHMAVEYIRHRGFPFHLDDIGWDGLPQFLKTEYGLVGPWSNTEIDMLWDELGRIEEQNEIREARRKFHELESANWRESLLFSPGLPFSGAQKKPFGTMGILEV